MKKRNKPSKHSSERTCRYYSYYSCYHSFNTVLISNRISFIFSARKAWKVTSLFLFFQIQIQSTRRVIVQPPGWTGSVYTLQGKFPFSRDWTLNYRNPPVLPPPAIITFSALFLLKIHARLCKLMDLYMLRKFCRPFVLLLFMPRAE